MKSKKKTNSAQGAMAFKATRDWLHHHLNSLHVYCRLVRFMPKNKARKMVGQWEASTIYRLMYAAT